MNIKLYIVGDKFDKFCYEGIKEYDKRLSRYCKFKVEQFKLVEQLERKLSAKTYKVGVSSSKNVYSSEQLAERLDMLASSGQSDVTFILGASDIEFDETISITPMDVEIGLLSLILTEQVYRAYRINRNEPYHK